MNGIISLWHDARVKFVVILVGVGVVAGLTWWGYSTYRVTVNEKAQLALAVRLDQFEKVAAAKDAAAEQWQAVAQGLSTDFNEHKSSDLAPFFLTFEAEALHRAGKAADAIALLNKALDTMGVSNPLYYLYKIKAVLLAQDAQQLQELAADVHNPHRGYALYEVWHQAWVAGNREAAAAALTKLMALGGQWAMLAQSQQEFVA